MSTTKSRLHEVDILYAFGTLLVIFGHSHSSDWTSFSSGFAKCIEFVYTFHMPLFFLIAGFLLARSDSVQKLGYFVWLKDKALRLLTPYVVVTFVLMIPKYFYENKGLSEITFYDLILPFLEPRNGVFGHFWFLYVLFIFYAVFGFLRYYDDYKKRQFRGLFSIAFFLLIFKFTPINNELFSISDIRDFSFYFFAGYLFYRLSIKKTIELKPLIRILISVLCFSASVLLFLFMPSFSLKKYIFKFIISLLMPVSLLQIALLLKYKNTHFLDFLSSNLFTFYIYAWPFQAAAQVVCGFFRTQWYILTPAMFLAGIIGPSIVIYIYNKFDFLHKRPIKLILGIR